MKTVSIMSKSVRSLLIANRFWEKVKKTRKCWIWGGAKNSEGYGHLKIPGLRKNILAHRLSWEIKYGEIPEGLDVLHSCDTPDCVRPKHLFLGMPLDNMRDCIDKGRRPMRNTKLDWERVMAIRDRRNGGDVYSVLSSEFGVSISQVSRICLGKHWREDQVGRKNK